MCSIGSATRDQCASSDGSPARTWRVRHRRLRTRLAGADDGDTFDDRSIRVCFLWRVGDGRSPRWEQAFSIDGGASWETNWTMDFVRDAP